MVTITCLRELEEKRELEFGDIVIFTVNKEILKYTVYQYFLSLDKIYNDTIFKLLKIDKYEIAEKTYGYKVNGSWPNSKSNDYPALTRLVKELYRIIEPTYTKFTRFEIMEI